MNDPKPLPETPEPIVNPTNEPESPNVEAPEEHPQESGESAADDDGGGGSHPPNPPGKP